MNIWVKALFLGIMLRYVHIKVYMGKFFAYLTNLKFNLGLNEYSFYLENAN